MYFKASIRDTDDSWGQQATADTAASTSAADDAATTTTVSTGTTGIDR